MKKVLNTLFGFIKYVISEFLDQIFAAIGLVLAFLVWAHTDSLYIAFGTFVATGVFWYWIRSLFQKKKPKEPEQ